MGTLDGAGISYLVRESDEMSYLEDSDPANNGGRYPTFAIDKVNHAQVSSGKITNIFQDHVLKKSALKDVLKLFFSFLGPMPDIVTNQDIDPEVSNEEAFTRYATPAVAFMVTQKQDFFDGAVIYYFILEIEEAQTFTDNFLAPFRQMMALEDENGSRTPWIEEGNFGELHIQDWFCLVSAFFLSPCKTRH